MARDSRKDGRRALRRLTAYTQAGFYVGTGVWPIFDMRTFQAVTGPKTDHWLVKTVGACVAVVGGVVGLAASRSRITPEIALLGAGTAAALTGIDLVYVAKGRISKIYLLDAAAETALIAMWALAGADEVEAKGAGKR
ncbi:MAG TPA: hypothetical protein VFR15_17640 [Chloroflexia bacterium]|nr:hypothetical protein [Chloroflexia bacterium]